jgi:4-amino-4-deoxy-L-arabinose transferase-like glycosyltransferase
MMDQSRQTDVRSASPCQRLIPAALLLGTFVLRAFHPAQPIVENAVGRQIPTAMVARNLERGSGFLRPLLDTGPHPNLFLVEPPLYAQLVAWLRASTHAPREILGRLLSAAGFTLAAWGLWRLAARRGHTTTAAYALLILATLPVGMRYGRAFQPDALMSGCWWAALCCWDDICSQPRSRTQKRRLAMALGFTACALALKLIWAFLLIPVVWALMTSHQDSGRMRKLVFLGLAILPALAWYGYAAVSLRSTGGSVASADNAAIWLASPGQLFAWSPWVTVLRTVARAYTLPVLILASIGLARVLPRDRAAQGFLLACGLTFLIFAPKFHHEYYALVPAPFAAWAVALGLKGIPSPAPRCVWLAACGLVVWGTFSAWRTFQTPPEWQGIEAAGTRLQQLTAPGSFLVASEALLYYADRPGGRMEWSPDAARRAAGEWRGVDSDPNRWKQVAQPLDLIDFYRTHGAEWFADLPRPSPSADQDPVFSLHALLRERYRVCCETPVFLVDLRTQIGTDHAQPPARP